MRELFIYENKINIEHKQFMIYSCSIYILDYRDVLKRLVRKLSYF